MTSAWFQKLSLAAAGLSALSIGGAVLASPGGFFAGHGVELGTDASLLGALRVQGAMQVALGGAILSGIFRPQLLRPTLVLAAIVYLASAAGSVIGMLADGMPADGLVQGTATHIFIAILCLTARAMHPVRRSGGDHLAGLPG